jgi:hypothetical protein
MKTIKAYGTIGIRPIRFPDVVEPRFYPLSLTDDKWLGGSFPLNEPKSWEWVRSNYSVREQQFLDVEELLKQGKTANLATGKVTLELPDDADVPEDCIISDDQPTGPARVKYRIHIQVADGSRLYDDYKELDHIPKPGDTFGFTVKGFSDQVAINRDGEFGHRKTEDGITEVHLYAHPVRYDD